VVGAERTAGRQGQGAVRRLSALFLLTAACAQPGMPPGGPPDDEAPAVVRIRPDTNARNVRGGSIAFDFDEVVSERPTGAPSLAGLFTISPSTGDPEVSWKRTHISVSPRGGLRRNTTYVVTMLPGLTDLDGNVDSVGRRVVFSTGPEIATGAIRGIAFDWLAQRAAPQALVEAFALPDSTRYLTLADSTGRFALDHLPPGRFLLRATVDQNHNRAVDPRELFDTATVTLADSLRREMLTFVHDSLGPGIASVSVLDSLTLRVSLDRPVDTTTVVDTSHFVLKRSDSTRVALARALTAQAWDSLKADSARRKAVQDSVRAAARADSLRKADTTRAAVRPPPPPDRRTGQRPGAPIPPAPPRDTARREPPPKPSVAAPTTEVILRLGAPLEPGGGYRLRSEGLRSLLGHERSSERVFSAPKARPRTDSTAARDTTRGKRDTTGRAPPPPPTGDGSRQAPPLPDVAPHRTGTDTWMADRRRWTSPGRDPDLAPHP
jgi:Bacterial Ig-like domain